MQKLLFANWKSHKLVNQVQPWFDQLGAPPAGVQLVVMPPTTLLSTVAAKLPADVRLGAQNVSPFPLGAYTGEIAADQLADLGVQYCLVGHSERRQYFGETNEQVATKCQILQAAAITPVVCVDQPYMDAQLTAVRDLGVTEFVLAYEPLGSIGTGNNVALDQVKKVLTQARTFGEFPFIYGGSVSAENVAEYLLICDGALVATASLDGEEFARVLSVAAAQESSFS